MILFAEIPLGSDHVSDHDDNKKTGVGTTLNNVLNLVGLKKQATLKTPQIKKMPGAAFSATIPIYLSERKGISRITLSFSAKMRRMVLRAPPRTSRTYLRDFIKTHYDWIQQQFTKPMAEPKAFEPGMAVPFQGRSYVLTHHVSNKVIVEAKSNTLFVQSAVSRVDTHVRRWLLKQAVISFELESYNFAKTLGVSIEKITVKSMHTRWGSCSSDGNLNYNWRLILAPPEILSYVCAHEVSHRLHMNHSAAFWQTVEALYPRYKAARLWLKKNGASLYVFG